MTDCNACQLPEHDPLHWSWRYVSPLALSTEILTLDTPDAWDTADHVFYIEKDGAICHSKGHQATGNSTFVSLPPIPGLRLDFGSKRRVTLAHDFGDEKREGLHRRLGRAVAVEVLRRSNLLLDVDAKYSTMSHMLMSGHLFTHKIVGDIRRTDDKMYQEYNITVTKIETKKRPNNDDDDNEPEEGEMVENNTKKAKKDSE